MYKKLTSHFRKITPSVYFLCSCYFQVFKLVNTSKKNIADFRSYLLTVNIHCFSFSPIPVRSTNLRSLWSCKSDQYSRQWIEVKFSWLTRIEIRFISATWIKFKGRIPFSHGNQRKKLFIEGSQVFFWFLIVYISDKILSTTKSYYFMLIFNVFFTY